MAIIRPISMVAGGAVIALASAFAAQAEEVSIQPSTMAEVIDTFTVSQEGENLNSHLGSDSATELVIRPVQTAENLLEGDRGSDLQPTKSVAVESAAVVVDASVSTSAEAFFADSELAKTPETVDQTQEVAQLITRPLDRGVAPFYVGVGGNIGIVDSDESAVGDFGFNLISKVSLGPRFSIRPTASFSEEDVSVAIPLTYNFNPLEVGAFDIHPAAGIGIDIGDDIGFLVNGGIDVPISRQFTVNGQINWRATSDIGLGVSLGVAYNFPFFFE